VSRWLGGRGPMENSNSKALDVSVAERPKAKKYQDELFKKKYRACSQKLIFFYLVEQCVLKRVISPRLMSRLTLIALK
jgi:hypothetical protein